MEAVIALLVGAASVAWWQRTRRKRHTLEEFLAGDAQVVLHVAEHAQRSRSQVTLTTVHLLYGLLQDEEITRAIRTVGGEVEPLEDRVLAALDAPSDHQVAITSDAQTMLAHAVTSAHHQGRKASATDLWAYLLRTDAYTLVEEGKLDALGALHVLVHTTALPALEATAGDVHVVIRNDDYSPQDFVTRVLVDVFGLPAAEATTTMMSAHTEGKAILARLPVAAAHAKIRDARELARSQRFPLWIAAEPV